MTQKRWSPKTIVKQTLADQVAESLKESILSGEWGPNEALPTEPELAESFGVSRAVVRDATRMLAAQGLVEVRHGRGVFVTSSQAEAFGEALLLALRREQATVWDVEHFEQILYPEVFALAAVEATDEELEALRVQAMRYLDIVRTVHETETGSESAHEDVQALMRMSYQELIRGIFAATHNQLLLLLAAPLLSLRNVRSWQVAETADVRFFEIEAAYFNTVIDAISSRDAELVRETMKRLLVLPKEAEQVMRETPVGEVPEIYMDPPSLA